MSPRNPTIPLPAETRDKIAAAAGAYARATGTALKRRWPELNPTYIDQTIAEAVTWTVAHVDDPYQDDGAPLWTAIDTAYETINKAAGWIASLRTQ